MAGNLLLKGYTAAIANVLTTELNSLADGNVSALSSEQTNASTLDIFGDLQLDLASLTIASTAAYVGVYFVPSVDGTNYPDWTSGAYANYMAQYLVGIILVKNVSATTARANGSGMALPPGKFKVALRNATGAALAASGNTLGIRDYAGSYT